ncbi:MAG: hypothetical protein JNJ49_15850 [Bdellovibrionaceae bacterium]|nr:hypothetical protein [Pseudobdellovibrionaceae bacterium]
MSATSEKPNAEMLEYLDILLIADSPEQLSEIAENPDLIENLELHDENPNDLDEEIDE